MRLSAHSGAFPLTTVEATKLPRHQYVCSAGLVERPCQLSMDELAQRFPQHSVLATLSCVGNRWDAPAFIPCFPDGSLR